MSTIPSHILSVKQFDTNFINDLFSLTEKMRQLKANHIPCRALEGYVLGNLFFEASTRSRMSFASAFLYLGGAVNSTTGVIFSSISKGESLLDTLNVIPMYCDVLVVRHPELGAVSKAAEFSNIPIINAGDGPGEHPTQALLDLYTVYKEKGRMENLTISMVGDLRFGRTVHSLTRLLCLYKHIKFIFAAPEVVQLPRSILEEVKSKGHTVEITDNYNEAISKADIIYSTRIQRERFEDPDEYKAIDGKYVLSKQKVESFCKPDVTIMHPLPRTNEIDPNLDTMPNAAYFRQAENGLYVRMALFLKVLGKERLFTH